MALDEHRRRVLVTGGSGSIGRRLVSRLSADRALMVFFQFCSDEEAAASLAASTGAVPVQADFRVRDLSWMPDELDVLVSNAGINICSARCEEVTPEEWHETLRINLEVPFELMKRVLPGMKKRRWGRVVNISSIYGLVGCEQNTPYVVSKFGLNGLSRSVAREVASFGVTVNLVCPGAVDSTLLRRLIAADAMARGVAESEVAREYAEMNPSGRLATADDVAESVAFLIGDGASHVNGTSMIIDGGQLA